VVKVRNGDCPIDEVTVTYGAQKFSPIQFHTLDIGPFTMTTPVGPNETPEEAFGRAYAFLERQARAAFKAVLPEYMERARACGDVARRK
jgi:hypothetical protein